MANATSTVLIVLGGLPGTGKTTIARELARRLSAVFLRVDSIEHVLSATGVSVDGAGYGVAQAIAEDNLRLGRIVVADCVNPWPLTRDAWRAVAERAGVRIIDVEIVCSDHAEHRRRVESRVNDIPGHVLPTWRDVVERDYRPWTSDRLVIETAGTTAEQCVSVILAHLAH